VNVMNTSLSVWLICIRVRSNDPAVKFDEVG
jgi:hypothetical protein